MTCLVVAELKKPPSPEPSADNLERAEKSQKKD